MKRYVNSALLYAILAMAGGVFYREFTKFSGFAAKTTLSVVHTHYFLLGMVFSCCSWCWKRICPSPEQRPGGCCSPTTSG